MDTTLQDPLVGHELDGRYLVRSRIARGGMATVYLALDRRLDREVAVKVMHAHLADDEQFTARFVREARAAARLSHPNVVQVYDQGEDGDLLYLAMEYLRGRTLRDVLAERGVLTPREALTVIDPVLDALAAAHRHGIVHRDVKPENVILTDDGRVKVADFGLARAATANTSTTGVLMGTVAYLAPELVLRGVADARSDVYAAGIMLFEMLTGRQPFSGDVPIQVAYQHVNEQVPAPSTLVPELPAVLDDVVTSATAREADDRPDDAAEMLVALRAARAELTEAQLDTRPDLPERDLSEHELAGPSGRRGQTGALTEIFDHAPTQQATQALPSSSLPPSSLPSGSLPSSSGSSSAFGQPALRTPSALPAARTGPAGSPSPAGGASSGAAKLPPELEPDEMSVLRRRRRVIGVTSLLVVIGLTLALTVAAWYYALGPGAFITTPAVTGVQADQAAQSLQAQGLRSTRIDVFDAAAGVGIVVSTDPEAGSPVRKDGAVELRVSKGPEFVAVPAVVGKPEDVARAALADAHLTTADGDTVYSDLPKGQVVSADPAPGQRVHNGDTVTLTLSKGPAPVDVPNVKGMSRADAESALRKLRLGVNYGEAVNDDVVPAGAVLTQSPDRGTLVPGQKVTLVLSKGPELITVPSVVGKQFGPARAILEGLGFSVDRNNVIGGFFGTVRLQNPPGGSQVPKGSTITLTVV